MLRLNFHLPRGGGPFVGTEIFGLTPEQLGLYFGAPAMGYFAGNYPSGRWSQKFGIDAMVFSGLGFTSLGSALSLIVRYIGYGSSLSFLDLCVFWVWQRYEHSKCNRRHALRPAKPGWKSLCHW